MKNLALPFALTAAAALALGFGVGGATAQPETLEKIVEVEKIVEKTPAACAEAFAKAEKVFASSAKVIGYGQDAVKAAARMDADGILAQKRLVDIETDVVLGLTPQYNNAKKECLR